MKSIRIVRRSVSALAMLSLFAVAPATAQTPGLNGPPPPPQPADVRPDAAPLTPTLLAPGATREAIVAWLSQNVPTAHGKTVYVNGTEAFWIEHADVDAKNDMKITATLHAENFADGDATWRSSYQVTQFDCETQQQMHVYLTWYPGAAMTGAVRKQTQLIKRGEFVGPTTQDFAHLRVVCLAAYDRLRPRPYAVQVP